MARRDLEESEESGIPVDLPISAEFPEGYHKNWVGPGTAAKPASGRAVINSELGASAIRVAQSRNKSFYFSIEGHNFRADPSGEIEQGHGGIERERRKAIYQLLTEGRTQA